MTSSIGAQRRAQARYRALRHEKDVGPGRPQHRRERTDERDRLQRLRFQREHLAQLASIVKGHNGFDRASAQRANRLSQESRGYLENGHGPKPVPPHRTREEMLAIAGMPKRRTHIKLQAARGPAGHTTFHLVVPEYLIREMGFKKGDTMKIRVGRGRRIIYEPDGKHGEK